MKRETTFSRTSCIFYRSVLQATSSCNLSPKEELSLLKGILYYALDGTLPKISGASKAIFICIQPLIDANKRKYAQEVLQKRSSSLKVDQPSVQGHKSVSYLLKPITNTTRKVGKDLIAKKDHLSDTNSLATIQHLNKVSKDLHLRKAKFIDYLRPFSSYYSSEIMNAFYKHWTQIVTQKGHMLWEGIKNWNTASRLSAFATEFKGQTSIINRRRDRA